MRIVVFGNAGSGKSTYARALAARHGLSHLDLDTIVWEPRQLAVQRSAEETSAALAAFLAAHERWVVEGCYGELVAAAARECTKLVFLAPGLSRCLENNRRRPFEPHKYESPQAQDAMLPALQAWVTSYYQRDDDWSHAAHRRLFDAFDGPKEELRDAVLEAPLLP